MTTGRRLRPGQRADLTLLRVETGARVVSHSFRDRLVEAPNWHPDGRSIVVNGDGRLFVVVAQDPSPPQQVRVVGLPPVNNDHLVSPDGDWHLASATDGHIYRVPWAGGRAERLTTSKDPTRRFRHFLHGISADGDTIAYVGTEELDGDEWGRRALWTMDLATGAEDRVGDGFSPADGPEFHPDGRGLLFNSEARSAVAGHAQLFRMERANGTVRQLTDDERVNWFPHASPDGRFIAYLSYPPGTLGHPADLPVELRLIEAPSGPPRTLASLFGGQGTVNVNSWSPDSAVIAYVAYPVDGDLGEPRYDLDEEERCT